jgi:hypothetical protein
MQARRDGRGARHAPPPERYSTRSTQRARRSYSEVGNQPSDAGKVRSAVSPSFLRDLRDLRGSNHRAGVWPGAKKISTTEHTENTENTSRKFRELTCSRLSLNKFLQFFRGAERSAFPIPLCPLCSPWLDLSWYPLGIGRTLAVKKGAGPGSPARGSRGPGWRQTSQGLV